MQIGPETTRDKAVAVDILRESSAGSTMIGKSKQSTGELMPAERSRITVRRYRDPDAKLRFTYEQLPVLLAHGFETATPFRLPGPYYRAYALSDRGGNTIKTYTARPGTVLLLTT